MTPDRSELRPGEPITLQVMCNGDGFIWLFAADAAGGVECFFPGRQESPSAHKNQVRAGVQRIIPTQSDGFALSALDKPGAAEDIIAVVTQSPDFDVAHKYLKQIRPDLSSGTGERISVVEKPAEAWGAAHLTYRVIGSRPQ